MVSLEQRLLFKDRIKNTPKIDFFYKFLFNEDIILLSSSELSSIDRVYYSLLFFLKNDNIEDFKSSYNEFSRREPTEDSTWINDDWLIFLLILGVCKYNINRQWLISAISLRKTSNIQQKRINLTLINILNSNLQVVENIEKIVIVFQHMTNLPITIENLNQFYINIEKECTSALYEHNYFIWCLSIKSLEIILIQKEIPPYNQLTLLKEFEQEFIKKTKVLINNFLLIIGLILGGLIVYYGFINPNDFEIWQNILGALGLGGGGLLSLRKVKGCLNKIILKYFGYKTIL